VLTDLELFEVMLPHREQQEMDKVQVKYLFYHRTYDNFQKTACLSVMRGFHPSLIVVQLDIRETGPHGNIL
jgi:3-keto-L-gulonate-6-phosphate decarboxylase